MSFKNRQQMLMIVAGVVIGLFLADRLVLTPLLKSWRQRSARLEDLRKKVNDGRSLISREQSLRSRWDLMRKNALPNNHANAEQQVLKAVDRWAQDTKTSLLSISPQWKQDSEEYAVLECRVEASGTLGAVSQFLYHIEKDPMALKLQAVELSSRDNEGQQIALGLQLSGLILTPKETRK